MPADTPRPSRRPGSAGPVAGLPPPTVAATETGRPAGPVAGLLPPAVAAAETGRPAGPVVGLLPPAAASAESTGRPAGLIAGLLPPAAASAESVGRPAGLIAGLLPPAVASAESTGSPAAAAPGLLPAEAEAVRTAGPRRRAEFAAGRSCARAALATLGVAAGPILPGPAGQPLWPAGVTGSITHCAGYQACAVARAADVAAIGIDAEPDAPLPAGLIERIATAPELAWISRHVAVTALPPAARVGAAAWAPAAPPPAAPPSAAPAAHVPPPAAPGGVSWDRLLFSAKEAARKLWYPLTGQWPGFREVTVGLATNGTFTACLPSPGPADGNGRMTQLTGRWLARDGLIVTAIVRAPR